MKIDAKPLLALRTSFIVVCVVVWNVACLTAFSLIDWDGELEGPGMWILFGVTSGFSITAMSIVGIPPLRRLLTDPTRRDRYRAEPFVFIALILGLMAVMILWQP